MKRIIIRIVAGLAALLLFGAYIFGIYHTMTKISMKAGLLSLFIPPVSWYYAAKAPGWEEQRFFVGVVEPRVAELIILLDMPDETPGKKEKVSDIIIFFRGIDPDYAEKARKLAMEYIDIARLTRDLYVGDIDLDKFRKKFGSLGLVKLVRKYNTGYQDENIAQTMKDLLNSKSGIKDQSRMIKMLNENIATAEKVINGIFKGG
jgi:hypothetical protein